MTNDLRPYLDDWLRDFPFTPTCHCDYNGGPEPDCPEHGDVRLYSDAIREHRFAARQMAQVVDNVAHVADDLMDGDERDREIALRILCVIAETVNITRPPDPWSNPGSGPVPF